MNVERGGVAIGHSENRTSGGGGGGGLSDESKTHLFLRPFFMHI